MADTRPWLATQVPNKGNATAENIFEKARDPKKRDYAKIEPSPMAGPKKLVGRAPCVIRDGEQRNYRSHSDIISRGLKLDGKDRYKGVDPKTATDPSYLINAPKTAKARPGSPFKKAKKPFVVVLKTKA